MKSSIEQAPTENRVKHITEGTPRKVGLWRIVTRTRDKVVERARKTGKWMNQIGSKKFNRRVLNKALDEVDADAAKRVEKKSEYTYGVSLGPNIWHESRPEHLYLESIDEQDESDRISSLRSLNTLKRIEEIRMDAIHQVFGEMKLRYKFDDADIKCDDHGEIWISPKGLKKFRSHRENKKPIRRQRRVRIRRRDQVEMLRRSEDIDQLPLIASISRRDKKESSIMEIFEQELKERFRGMAEPKLQDVARAQADIGHLQDEASAQFVGKYLIIEQLYKNSNTDDPRYVFVSMDIQTGEYVLLKLVSLKKSEQDDTELNMALGPKVSSVSSLDQSDVVSSEEGFDTEADLFESDLEEMTTRKWSLGIDDTTIPGNYSENFIYSLNFREEEFDLEVRTLRILQGEGAPKVYDSGRVRDWGYYTMEYIRSKNLSEIVEEKGPFPAIGNEERVGADEILISILEILQLLHENEPVIIHRDIKPANILLQQKERRLFAIDFGGGITPKYAPPEVHGDFPYQNEEGDVYLTAATVYYTMTGMNPYGTTETLSSIAASLREDPIPLRDHIAEIPEELDKLIEDMLHKKSSLRPSVAEALRRAEAIRERYTRSSSSLEENLEHQFEDEKNWESVSS